MNARPSSRAFDRALRRWSPPLALAALSLLAWAPAAEAQRLPFAIFTADEGLPATQIWDFHEDRKGLLWIATTWGVARYDGRNFSTLSVPEGIPSPNIRTLLEAPNGDLWIGTNGGLSRFDGRQIVTFRDDPQLPNTTVWASALDHHGQLWFGTEAGLVARVGDVFRRHRRGEGIPGDYVYSLFVASDGALWIGTRGQGAARCRPLPGGALADCRTFDERELGAGVVRSFAEDRKGRILVGTRGAGVAIHEAGSFTHLRAADGLPSDDVYALLVRRGGEVIVGSSDQGFAICLGAAPGRCTTLGEVNGLPALGVRALAEDHEGSLWIGTEGGVARLSDEEIRSYSEAEGLSDRQVYALVADPDGTLWAGTFDGLSRLSFGPYGEPTVRTFKTEQGLPATWVWSLLRDRRGRLWIGTERGVCRLLVDGCQVFGAAQGLPGDVVYALTEDLHGDVWAGTTQGLARIATGPEGPEIVQTFTRADGLLADRGYALAVDGGGRLWVSHTEGLSWFDGRRFHGVAGDAGLPAHTVRALGVARDGALLAGGYGHVSRRNGTGDPPRFRTWGSEAGLGDVLVLTVAEVEAGHLLLGTNRGVLLFDPVADAGRGAILRRFDRDNGAIATEVSHSGAFARDRSGRSWFGFKGGVTGLPPDLLGPSLPPPPVAIVGLVTGRGRIFRAPFSAVAVEPIGWLGESVPEVPHGDAELRVTARAVSFLGQDAMRFQFRLEGVESDWSEPRPEPFRDFMNLPPGKHRVAARAARADGGWGEPAELAFVVLPAWWQTATVRLLALLAAVVLFVTGLRWRLARSDRRTRELERQIAERTDDLARYAQALAEHLQAVDGASERMRRGAQARREMFARTSHELRTPLTAILGFSELLERSLAERLAGRERRYLANVRDGGEHLLRLVNNLLDQLKLEAGRMEVHLEEVALETMIESVVSLMEGFALHRGVELETRSAGELPVVRADVAKLRQVLLNLLSNAVKFSPRGEVVALEARAVPAAESRLGVDSYELSVRDRGPGIADSEREAIFEPYRQLSSGGPPVAGTGLGLPIARQLVELLGGVVELEPGSSSGSTFRVLLPVDPSAARSSSTNERGDRSPEEARPRLLIVEPDRPEFARLARRLEREDLLAVRASGADEARRMLPELRPVALAVRIDPAVPARWRLVAEVIEAARASGSALSLLIADEEGLGFALSLDAVIGSSDVEADARAALAVLDGDGMARGRRPVLVVAAGRESGVVLAAALRRAGAEAFRVEGAREVLGAFEQSPTDALVLDLDHLVRLAPEVGGGRTSPAVAFGRPKILLAGSEPDAVELARLAVRLREQGGEAGLALAGSVRALLARSVRRRSLAV